MRPTSASSSGVVDGDAPLITSRCWKSCTDPDAAGPDAAGPDAAGPDAAGVTGLPGSAGTSSGATVSGTVTTRAEASDNVGVEYLEISFWNQYSGQQVILGSVSNAGSLSVCRVRCPRRWRCS